MKSVRGSTSERERKVKVVRDRKTDVSVPHTDGTDVGELKI